RGFFDVLDKKMVSAYVSGKDEYLKQFERKKPSTALSKIIRQIRLSVHTGFELPKEVKAILADKKLIEKMVDEHRARYYNDKSVKETRDENAWALLPFFRVENISAALKQLHKNNLLSALIPEIKNVSRKRINYMLKNISLAENTKNERFAALLTAFDREMALLVLNNFPKTLSGPIDEIVLEDKDINEIMKKYDDITTGSNIFKSKKAKEKKPNLNSSKITEQLENLSKTSEELNINNGDVKADFKPTPLARGFEKSLYDAKRQSLYPVIDEHKVDNKHLKHSMSSQSAYASLLSAS
ncbi:MAG: hypothetical protein LBL00_05365, partial [Endomicrobium sp.]|nr:hypothetical protein [Endomicrobium sp.]